MSSLWLLSPLEYEVNVGGDLSNTTLKPRQDPQNRECQVLSGFSIG
jgi:hypothetical protein